MRGLQTTILSATVFLLIGCGDDRHVDCEDGECTTRCLDEGHEGGGFCEDETCHCVDGTPDGDADSDTDSDGDGDCQDLDEDGFCAGADEDCDDSNADTYPDAEEVCDGEDNDCDGTLPVGEIDADADGFMVCEGDCDDTTIELSPDADEICDGIDNDCDELVDDEDTDIEDAPTWYEDLDEDGYGDPEVSEDACEQPDGYVDNDDDCDDIDPDINPDVEEVCDGDDNNCDGEVDEELLLTFYEDFDEDGFGDPLVSEEACRQPRGYVEDDTDCDDVDATIYPGAPELCDGEDNDCDDEVPADEDDGDEDGQRGCEGDCDDTDPDVGDGFPEVCDDGIDNDCDDDIDEGLGEDEDCPASSCLELHERRPVLDSDAYWTLVAAGEPRLVYCDMETGGGGWTALTNPVDPRLPGVHPDLVLDGVATPGGGPCGVATPQVFAVDGWRDVRAYVCASNTVRLFLSWVGEADDVMFLATAQGQETHTVTVNGIDVPPDALTDDYMQCAFWNDDGDLIYPEGNMCWQTVLIDAAPHMELDVLDGGGLEMVVEAGPSCSPDCLHGTGANVTRLFVR